MFCPGSQLRKTKAVLPPKLKFLRSVMQCKEAQDWTLLCCKMMELSSWDRLTKVCTEAIPSGWEWAQMESIQILTLIRWSTLDLMNSELAAMMELSYFRITLPSQSTSLFLLVRRVNTCTLLLCQLPLELGVKSKPTRLFRINKGLHCLIKSSHLHLNSSLSPSLHLYQLPTPWLFRSGYRRYLMAQWNT